MNIYRDIILDHYKNPRNFGHLDRSDIKQEDGNVTCGDRIIIELAVKGKRNNEKYIEDIRFSGEGCAISQASASILTEKVKGMTIDDIKKLDASFILTMLGTTLTPSRTKCALLSLEVLQKAVGKICS
jgi:nitrogen fixation NifU-like protein